MSEDQLNPRLYEALEYAHQLFGRDARKKSQVPVMSHLLSVCALVQQDGGDEDEAIAALLHDALEDKPEQTSKEVIRDKFGTRVVELIVAATDTSPEYSSGKKEPWRVRKNRYLEHTRRTAPDLLRVTIADRVDNVRAILADYQLIGDELWERFNAGKEDQLWYHSTALKAYRQAGFKGPLIEELERLIKALELATS